MTNNLDYDKPIKCTLRSSLKGLERARSIYIPLKYVYKTRKIQSLVLESENMDEFHNHLSLWPSLEGVYIPDKIVDFINNEKTSSEEQFKLYDKIFLETCLHMAQDDLSKNNLLNNEYGVLESNKERMEKIRNHQEIKRMLESL
jgi:hypothetical protein